MLTDGQIIRIIETTYPEETIIAGSFAVEKIVKEHRVYKPAGGANFDVASALAILSTALTIIKSLLDIYKTLQPNEKNVSVLSEKVRKASEEKSIEVEPSKIFEIVKMFLDLVAHE
jgi:hypothetical protein